MLYSPWLIGLPQHVVFPLELSTVIQLAIMKFLTLINDTSVHKCLSKYVSNAVCYRTIIHTAVT